MLSNKKDLLTEINVTSTPDCLIQKLTIDKSRYAKQVKLNVGTSCEASVYINGRLSGKYLEGAHELVLKKLSDGDKLEIVGTSADKHFKILFGIGGIPFKDREARLDALVGIHGECSCKLIDGDKIYRAYGAERSKVTAEDLTDDLLAKLQERLTTELAKKLETYTYHEVFTSISDLSDIVKKQFNDVLKPAGVNLLECSLSQPNFPEDYLEKRDKAQKEKMDILYPKSESKDAALLKDLLQNKGKVICSHCNKENDADAKHCKYCGRKIK